MPRELVSSLDPDGPPAQPKDSATVVLLRDTHTGPEVFLQRRVTGMAFAGGMTVFPGGGVDERDSDATISWSGPSPAWWAQRFGCPEYLARALVCAAVRETFEESGVLLAARSSGDVVSDTRVYSEARGALVSRELSLAGFLADADLTLRADLLRPLANWVTPVGEPRRYDTRFFLAGLPQGQRADGATTEAESSGWQLPSEALAEAKDGTCQLMPPTWITLTEIGKFPSTADALAADRSIAKVMPYFVREGDDVRVVFKEAQ